jgi:hypothetical protein
MPNRSERSRALVEAVLVEQAGFVRYQTAQRRAREARAHPLQFDESGFPIKQERASFAARVTRLLRPF